MEGEGDNTNGYRILFNLQNSIFLCPLWSCPSALSSQDLLLKTSTVTEAFAFAQCAVERPFQNRENLSAKPSSKALIFISMHSPVGWMFYDQIWVATNGNFNHKPPTLPVLACRTSFPVKASSFWKNPTHCSGQDSNWLLPMRLFEANMKVINFKNQQGAINMKLSIVALY